MQSSFEMQMQDHVQFQSKYIYWAVSSVVG